MARNKGYYEGNVVLQLNKKADLIVDSEERIVSMLHGGGSKGDVGIRSRGKIDFLVNFCGYRKMWRSRK